ncbi:MAG: S41 family peptidase [Gemmatimonadota bacterium]|nr:MAG: S41 family peptidase [Gemmatimonadota bacterium]
MQLKRSFWKPAAVGLVAIVSGGWLLQQGAQGNVYLNQKMLQDVIRVVSDRFVEPVDPADLYDMAVEGLIEQLGDPHTTLLRPEDYSQLRLTTTGNYGGLGIRIDEKDGWITVVQTLPNTPAERAGLRPGDRLIEADGVSMADWTPDDAVRVLRGPKGSPVDLKIVRAGVPEPFPVRIVRDEIHVEYVTSFMLDDEVGYVLQTQFSNNSAEEIHAEIRELRDQGMRGLILDLRDNPGGLLEEGVAVSDLFLDGGSEVVETRSRITNQNETYFAERRPVEPELPVVVLVNWYSASASEIVAGALQDHDRALVLGTPTFGKGSVQTLYPVAGGNYLKITTAKWYTPSGRSIHRERDVRPEALVAAGHAPVSETGSSAGLDAEVFYTDAGREVYGGGGIRPDLVIIADTLYTPEAEFRRSLGEQLSQYYDALFRYAVEYVNDHPDLYTDFEVSTAMLDRLYQRIVDAGIELDRQVFDGANRLNSRDLAIQIATVAFDEVVAQRRRLLIDRQLATAAELLRGAGSQEQLFVLAAEREGDEIAAAIER